VDGVQGVEMWETWQPDLVWMDIQLPEMDGYGATRQIKAHAAVTGRQAITIALTASAFEEDRKVILEAGCDGFVLKPFREYEIFETIRRYLDLHFIYETITPMPDRAAGVSFDDLRVATEKLPAEWVADLHQAAVTLDVEWVLALVEPVRSQAPQLADTLAKWARNFEFDKLLALNTPQ
jgi:CheY-like chemotaxis protein